MKAVQPQVESQSQIELSQSNAQQQRRLLCCSAILLLVVAAAVAYYLWLMTLTSSSQPSSANLPMLDRSEWRGKPPNGQSNQLETPVPYVIISHTATESCESEEICKKSMRLIQDFHMLSLGWDDIAYNFLVGGDGQVYVGRGWHVQGPHVKGYGAVSVNIAFIGTFTKVSPPARQLEAAKLLMEEGVRLHMLDSDYRIYAHRQLSATESPGEQLYALIKLWPRWTQEAALLRRLNNETLRLVSRNSWLAQPPWKIPQELELPIKRVQFVATQTESCSTQAACTFHVRYLQTFHIESQELADINYNFVVGGDGNVYIGRGWTERCEAPPDGALFEGLIVAFLGQAKPDQNQVELSQALLAEGVRLGHLARDYEVLDNLQQAT